jgi:hypothetical protein
VDCLPEIALVINTSKSSALPSYVTLYEVHFGWKPHWIRASPIQEKDIDDEDSIDSDNDNEYPLTDIDDIELTKIEARIVENNLKVYKQIAKKRALEVAFHKGDLVLLKVPVKLRLVGELPRIPVRIIKVVHGRQYSLMSKHSQIQGLYPGSDLNLVDPSSIASLSHGITIKLKKG